MSAAGAVPRTPAGMDRVLTQMTAGIASVESSQGSVVKLPKSELDLLKQIEIARDFMLDVLKNPDPGRVLLQEIFAGDCTRIARIQSVCENVEFFSEANSEDQRLRMCLSACESVEKVLVDLGMGETLAKAVAMERSSVRGGDGDDDGADAVSDECMQHVGLALAAEAVAIEFEKEGSTLQAVQKYEECHSELAAAIALVPAGDDDLQQLEVHRKQVGERIEYLKSVDGETLDVPLQDQIQPVDLRMHKSKKRRRRYIAACVAVGATGGIIVLGPVALVGAAGAAVIGGACGVAAMVGGATGAFCATRDGKVGDRAQAVGEVVVGGAEKVGEVGARGAEKMWGRERLSLDANRRPHSMRRRSNSRTSVTM